MNKSSKKKIIFFKVVSAISWFLSIVFFVYGASIITAGNISNGLLFLMFCAAFISLALDPGFLFISFPKGVYHPRQGGFSSRLISSITGILLLLWVCGKMLTFIFGKH